MINCPKSTVASLCICIYTFYKATGTFYRGTEGHRDGGLTLLRGGRRPGRTAAGEDGGRGRALPAGGGRPAQIGRAEVGTGGGRPGRSSFGREEVGRGGRRPGRRSAGTRAAGEGGGRGRGRRRCAGNPSAGSSSSSESERWVDGVGRVGGLGNGSVRPLALLSTGAVAMVVISSKRYVYTGKRFDTSMRSCGKHVPGCFARLVQLRLWLWRKPATKPAVCFDCPAFSSGKQVKAETKRPLGCMHCSSA
jgi:hypothetical protein